MRVPEGYKIVSNGAPHHVRFFLVDGIYPRWPICAKPLHEASTQRERSYTRVQESIRKDVECLFGVLQLRFGIMRRENQRWDLNEIVRIGNVCVILHNIIVRMLQYKDCSEEHTNYLDIHDMFRLETQLQRTAISEVSQALGLQSATTPNESAIHMEDIILRDLQLTDPSEHDRLISDLIELHDQQQ